MSPCRRHRDDVLPVATAGTGLDVAVAGSVAVGVDFTDYLSDRLPIFFGAVLGLSFLLLMVVFRSLLVPLKAVIMNLLSIGAAYGVVVAVFQWGWGGGLLDIEGAPIEPFVPMMLFAIVFGLSMDYEVFLLSRVREEYDRTGDNAQLSVADGLASTGQGDHRGGRDHGRRLRQPFLGESDRIVKLFGLGLSVAVLIDATIVRLAPRAGDDGAPRRPELVDPPLARPDPAQGPHRSTTRPRRRTRRTRPRNPGPNQSLNRTTVYRSFRPEVGVDST